jgi:hypothetical protein
MNLVLNQLKVTEYGNEISRSLNGFFDHSVIVFNFTYIIAKSDCLYRHGWQSICLSVPLSVRPSVRVEQLCSTPDGFS